MMRKISFNRNYVRIIAINLAILIFLDAIFPVNMAFALTSGPSSPEFSSFEPVATTDMVNLYTGDFTYNIPVLNVPGPDNSGYPLSLSYHSGTNVEEEASWVGYGWTLNPGAINRMKKGIPDDFDGNVITQYSKTKPNFTVSGTGSFNIEVFSNDFPINFGYSSTVRYNNYMGMSLAKGYSVNIKGIVSLGMSVRGTERTYSASINPASLLSSLTKKDDNKDGDDAEKTDKSEEQKKLEKKINGEKVKKMFCNNIKNGLLSNLTFSTNDYGLFSISSAPQIRTVNSFEGISYNYSASVQVNPGNVPIGVQGGYMANLTLQKNEEVQTNLSFGFMYPNLDNTISGGNISTDYFVEKGSVYTELDNFVGIPFNSSDDFVLTGEGLGGGFRIYHDKVFRSTPNKVVSTMDINQIGLEFMVGPDFGIGCDVGKGKNTLETGLWNNSGSIANELPDDHIFRFTNDPASSILYSESTDAESADILSSNDFGFYPDGLQYDDLDDSNSDWKKTSSCIEYSKINNDPICKSTEILENLEGIRSNTNIQNSLAEFSITNSDGVNYLYGLPVYNKDVYNIQVGHDVESSIVETTDYIIYKDIDEDDPSDHDTYIGDYTEDPYATSYLLTQITSPEYIDVNDNGPDDMDYGGWTKFNYRKLYGEDSESGQWYNWRHPYNGLYYQKNELSNLEDDLGTFSKGEKEMYYLKAIETKTHVAFFITNTVNGEESFADYIPSDIDNRTEILNSLNGSGEYRLDALGAADAASGSASIKNTDQRAEKLERIVLYSKNRFEKPIQTTYFDYDYGLVKNLPNSEYGNYPLSQNDAEKAAKSGKLTLKRIWTEAEGNVKSRISPYVFKYKYRINYADKIQLEYPDITSYGSLLVDNAQNPDYLPQALDMWGSINYDGMNRYSKIKPWVYQGEYDQNNFDPAAYQLKQIKLPSGGEIHIQYEQKDYSSVQDRNPMAMVSLSSYGGNAYDEIPWYELNLEDLGISGDTDKILDLYNLLYDYFINNDNKIYFKFLFNLTDDPTGLNTGKSEYIKGYASVSDITTVGSSSAPTGIRVTIDPGEYVDNFYEEHPRTLCYNFLLTQRGYKIDFQDQGGVPYDSEILDNYDEYVAFAGGRFKALKFIKDFAEDQFIIDSPDANYDEPSESTCGNDIEMNISYLKIPIDQDKIGGGIRVKRLLMYDPGIEDGTAALYGNEYIYKGEDGKSSGVASNEPSLGREENALVGFLPRLKQSYIKKLVAGKDRKQSEGPIGESLLPSPSVGYSRVIVKNIHSGKTNTGYTEHKFYTTRDFPYDYMYGNGTNANQEIFGKGVEMTNLHQFPSKYRKSKIKFMAGLFNLDINKVWLSQGFRFILNNMDGKTKSTATYFGEYQDDVIAENQILSSKTEYDYFAPGEKVPIWDGVNDISYEVPGKEMEIAIEQKKVQDKALDFSIEVDISVVVSWLPIIPGFGISFDYSDQAINTFATSKVIKYPVLVKSVRNYHDGIWSMEENLAFNPYTGSPLLTRSTDDYNNQVINGLTHDGAYYSYSIPAASIYDQMGFKSIDENNSNQLNQTAASIVTYGVNPLDVTVPEGVVSASATTYNNDWAWSDELLSEYGLDQTYIDALNSIYRPYENYVYKTDVISSNDGVGKVYSGGVFSDFTPYNFTQPELNEKWIRMNTVEMYSPAGFPLQERNILDVYSAVQYGYNKTMPIALAKNAKWSNIFFEDFELFTDAESEFSHSGSKCFNIPSRNYFITYNLEIDEQLIEKGGLLKFWMKCIDNSSDVQVLSNGVYTNCDQVARSGEWILYSAEIRDWGDSPANESLVLVFETYSDVWLDDIRFQPLDAQMTTYVYDVATNKLLTQFDDQHFGLYYQYNSDGKLIRKIVETERGIKTIQETQYNVPKSERILSMVN